MAQRERPVSPHLQIYKFQYTMVLSITHRMTGIALSLGSVLFVYWLAALASGREAYATAQAALSSLPAKVIWAGLILAFCYHLANGIRHLAWDLGYGFEKPQARASGWAVILITLALGALCLYGALRLTAGPA